MSFGWQFILSVLLILIFVVKADEQLSDSSLNFLHSKQKFEVLPGSTVSFSCRVEDGSAKVFLRHRFTPDTPEYQVHVNGKIVQQGQDFLINNIGYYDNGLYYCLAILSDGREAMKEIAELVVINQSRHVLNPKIHSLLLVCIGGLVVGFFVVCIMTILLILKQKGIIFKSLTQRIQEEAEKTAKQFKRGRRTTKSGSIWSWHEGDAMNSGNEEEATDFNDLPFIIRHSKIKEQLKTKPSTGSSPPPVPQTARPILNMAGPSQSFVPQTLMPPVPETPRSGMIMAGPSQSFVPQTLMPPVPETPRPGMIMTEPSQSPVHVPQVTESEAARRMTSVPPRPGTTVTGSQPPSTYRGSSTDNGSSMEHPNGQVSAEEVIYENIEDVNISSEEK